MCYTTFCVKAVTAGETLASESAIFNNIDINLNIEKFETHDNISDHSAVLLVCLCMGGDEKTSCIR